MPSSSADDSKTGTGLNSSMRRSLLVPHTSFGVTGGGRVLRHRPPWKQLSSSPRIEIYKTKVRVLVIPPQWSELWSFRDV